MARRASTRRATLFTLTLVLPCLVLGVAAVHLLREGAELARVRAAAEDQRRISDIGVRLLAQLERIKFDEASAMPAAADAPVPFARQNGVTWIGRVQQGALLLPWDANPASIHLARVANEGPFGEALRAGQRLEHVTSQWAQAATAYERAKMLAPDAAAADWAELLQARALVKCRCLDDARMLYARLLKSRAIDDQGVPLALYAAEKLLTLGSGRAAILNRIESDIDAPRHLAPPALYFARQLVSSLAATGSAAERSQTERLAARITRRAEDVERLLRLQREWSALPLASAEGRAIWVPFEQRWLVSIVTPHAGATPLAIAVEAAPAFETFNTALSVDRPSDGLARFSIDGTAGEPIGQAFPGLHVEISGAPVNDALRAWEFQRAFYITALLAVVGVVLAGAWFFWRDVRRDVRTAELRSQFVASVSHELRTPLTAIRMFAETLQLEQPLPADARAEYVRTIVSESERLTRLVNNVLDFSKIERGEKVYRLETGTLDPVVRQAVAAMRYPLAGHGFDLRVEVAPDLPPVRFDADAIQQAVMNLLSNAMKYSGQSKTIELSVKPAGAEVVIAVTDYGHGIPAANRARIFDRFYRAPVPENQQIPGAGLGLALVDHIIRGHGGRIELTSTVGSGSTFAIHLPCDLPPPAPTTTPSGAPASGAWRLRSAR